MASDSYYISSGGQTVASHGVALFAKNQALNCVFKKTTSKWKVSDDSVEQLVWYHVVVTWDINIGARMYRDGILMSEAPTASTVYFNPQGHDTLELGRAKGPVTLPKIRVNAWITHKFRVLRDTSAICAFHQFFWRGTSAVVRRCSPYRCLTRFQVLSSSKLGFA